MTNTAEMLTALRAFTEQATKLSGFPHLVQPYSGALVLARTIVKRADADLARGARPQENTP